MKKYAVVTVQLTKLSLQLIEQQNWITHGAEKLAKLLLLIEKLFMHICQSAADVAASLAHNIIKWQRDRGDYNFLMHMHVN